MDSYKRVVMIPNGRGCDDSLKSLLDVLSHYMSMIDGIIIATRDKKNVVEAVKKYPMNILVVDEDDWNDLVGNYCRYNREVFEKISIDDYGGVRNILLAFAAYYFGTGSKAVFIDDDCVPDPSFWKHFGFLGKERNGKRICITTGYHYGSSGYADIEDILRVLNVSSKRNNGINEKLLGLMKGACIIDREEAKRIRHVSYNVVNGIGASYGVTGDAFYIPFPLGIRGEDAIHIYNCMMRGLGTSRIPAFVEHVKHGNNNYLSITIGNMLGKVLERYLSSDDKPVAQEEISGEYRGIISKIRRRLKIKLKYLDEDIITMLKHLMRDIERYIDKRFYNDVDAVIENYDALCDVWSKFIKSIEEKGT